MSVRILTGDALSMLGTLPDASVNCCVTSPPYYGLRDYGMAGQIGLEETPDAYVAKMVAVMREVRRVLRDDGTLWLNIGDSYAANGARKNNNGSGATGLKRDGRDDASRLISASKTKTLGMALPPISTGCKPKDLIGIPWMLAFALRADGWYLRKDIIWHKPNPMPESVRDRPTSAHEYLFLLAKSSSYFYDADAIAELVQHPDQTRRVDAGGSDGKLDRGMYSGRAGTRDDGLRNKRSVWTIATKPFAEAHFATMAPELAETCIKAGCPADGTVIDPFGGAGTTALMADRLGRNAILIELNPAYVEIARNRLSNDAGMFASVNLGKMVGVEA